MKKLILLTLLPISVFSFSGIESPWVSLLDPELSQWDTYLSYRHQTNYNGNEPLDSKGNIIEPIGLNPNGYDVFTVSEKEEVPTLKVSGKIYGCLISKKEYENYHLKLKVKWGTKKWTPRKDKLKDSGILYHSIGPMGAEYWRSWMLSQEFQIMEGHMGDYWGQANSAIDIRAYMPEGVMNPVADPRPEFIGVGFGEQAGGYCMRSENAEKPHGEWNTLELICYDGKSLHLVNGKIVMILKKSRYFENGKSIPMTKGKIQIQSEAAEVFFKEINIRTLESLPEQYLRYF
ncbi:3-keto-disaccharide hydrolase [Reichenbachiella sp.]|uniref:3-keto-disaccharide hydrolase n=1 Tax=Reichenbachiella sp. TaxID=2184521 RepID=UPI003BB10006